MTTLIARIEAIFESKAAHEVEHFVVTLGSASLKVAASSPLGVAVLNAIKAGEGGATAVQKIGLAIESLTPFLVTNSPTAIETDIETVARTLIEGFLATLKETGPLSIIQSLETIALGA